MRKFELKLKEVRNNKGIKQSEVAEILDVPQQRISEYENGRVSPSLERLVELAQILDVTLDELVEFKKIQHKASNELLNK